MTGEEQIKCNLRFGCHECVLVAIQEDMRLFRAAVMQFISEGDRQKMLADGHSIVRKIDEWYSPKTEV
jgi:hypothetical protein